MSDPFAKLLDALPRKEAEVQIAPMRQMQMQQSISAYAHGNIALPDLHIARQGDTAAIPVLGEDGKPMDPNRRQQVMQGKPTYAQALERARDGMAVDYAQLFTDTDVIPEELGASAVRARPPIRKVGTATLMTDREHTMAVEAKDGPMSACCYSAPALIALDELAREYAIARQKVRNLGMYQLPPKSVHMSEIARRTIRTWLYARQLDTQLDRQPYRLFGLPVVVDDQLENEIRVYADASAPSLAGRYAALFIDRQLYDRLSIDSTAETEKLPTIQDPTT